MTKKLIVFSAPAKVGKDTAIEYLRNKGINLTTAECKTHLHKLTQDIFNVSEEVYWEIYNNRKYKEEWNKLFQIPEESFYKLASILHYHQYDSYGGEVRFVDDKDRTRFAINDKYWLSIREAVIFVSEVMVKPTLGKQYFGNIRKEQIDSSNDTLFGDASYGFTYELTPTIELLGKENILAIRIHRDGYTFDGDSRTLLPDGLVDNVVDVYNNGKEEDFLEEVYEHVINFTGE